MAKGNISFWFLGEFRSYFFILYWETFALCILTTPKKSLLSANRFKQFFQTILKTWKDGKAFFFKKQTCRLKKKSC